MINLISSTVHVSGLNREPCYICGKECEVMQSMMHAYTDIKVCGDCMIAHLYPFIESTKRVKPNAFRQVQANDRIESGDDTLSISIVESVVELIENRRLKVLNNTNDPSWTEHFSELKNEIGESAKGLQLQHALRGCRAWINYDAITRSLLIYFDGKPVENYVNWVDSRLATLHDCDSDAIVGVLIGDASQKQA